MRLLNIFPSLYNRSVSILTGGDFPQIQSEIADRWVHVHEKILSLTARSGRQAFLNARKGARTTCLVTDGRSAQFLSKKIYKHNLAPCITAVQGTLRQMGVIYKKESFDSVQASFLLGNFSESGRTRMLQASHAVLKQDGTLMLVEKRELSGGLKKLFSRCWDKPLSFIMRLVTGVHLVPVNDIEKLLDQAGFEICEQRLFYFGFIQLICAQKKQ